MKVLNPDNVFRIINGAELSEAVIYDKHLNNLFWEIAEKWNHESDVDYSISLDEIIDMVEQSPRYLKLKMGAPECVMESCNSLLEAKRVVKNKRRVL